MWTGGGVTDFHCHAVTPTACALAVPQVCFGGATGMLCRKKKNALRAKHWDGWCKKGEANFSKPKIFFRLIYSTLQTLTLTNSHFVRTVSYLCIAKGDW